MKTKRTILAIALAVMMMPSYAQKPVQAVWQTYDNFVSALYKGGYITSSSQSTYKNGYYRWIDFAVPKKDAGIISGFDGLLFEYGQRFAYSTLIKKAGTNDNNTVTIAYGEDNDLTYRLGLYNNRNYNVQICRDMKDSTMRYAYGLYWTERNDSLIGGINKFYGKDPRIEREQKEEKEAQLFGSSGVFNSIFGGGNGTSASNGNDGFGNPKIDTGADYLDYFSKLHILFSALNSEYNDYRQASGDDKAESIAIMNLMTTTMNKVSDLHEHYSQLLSKPQRKIVADQLKDMAEESKESSIAAVFKHIAKELK